MTQSSKCDLVTDAYRLGLAPNPWSGKIQQGAQRKVYLVLGPSRVSGKVRVATWSQASKSWSLPHAEPAENFTRAPEDWPQTRAARKWLDERGQGAAGRGRLAR